MTWRVGAAILGEPRDLFGSGREGGVEGRANSQKHDGLIPLKRLLLWQTAMAIMLAHFTMGNMLRGVHRTISRSNLYMTAPDSAVLKLRSILTKAAAT